MKLAPMLLIVGTSSQLPAQRLDPDWNLTAVDSRQHFAAGAGLGVASRIVLPKARTWQRLAVAGAIQAAWEMGQADATERRGRGFGFSPKDWLVGMAAASLVELVWRQ